MTYHLHFFPQLCHFAILIAFAAGQRLPPSSPSSSSLLLSLIVRLLFFVHLDTFTERKRSRVGGLPSFAVGLFSLSCPHLSGPTV